MSQYADYIREKTTDNIIEGPSGFATYRYLNEEQVYIVDIYTIPECRGTGHASYIADKIADEAKARGCSEMIGTVVPHLPNAALSMKVLMAYGMEPFAIDGNMVCFRKGI